MKKRYDLIVIGAGTTGLKALVHAYNNNKSTAVIESDLVGGTCLNKGCIPTKYLIYGADIIHEIAKAKYYGIKIKNVQFDYSSVIANEVDLVRNGSIQAEKNLKKMGIDLYKGQATFTGNKWIKVGNYELTADKIFIVTGALPFVPPIPGIEKINPWTNEEALISKKMPKSIALLGGGYISCEFAYFFASYGIKTTIIERNPLLVKLLDHEISEYLDTTLRELNVDILYNHTTLGFDKIGKQTLIKLKDNDSGKDKDILVDQVMINTGRKANTEFLGLDKTDVKLDDKGYIIVDDYLQTNAKDIYAFGDCIGRYQFAHMGKYEAGIAFNNAFSNNKEKVDYSVVPYAVFTSPPIGGFGLAEWEAKNKKLSYDVLKSDFKSIGKSKLIRDTRGFVKVVYDKKTRQILGVHIIGPDADNLIHEFAAVATAKGTIDVIQKTIHIHPTLAEVNTNLF